MEAQRRQWAVCGASAKLSLRRGTWRGPRVSRSASGSESAAGCCVASMGSCSQTLPTVDFGVDVTPSPTLNLTLNTVIDNVDVNLTFCL